MFALQEKVFIAEGDLNMKQMKHREIIQLERKGYYIVDVPYNPETPDKPMILFDIPDGRSKSMMQ